MICYFFFVNMVMMINARNKAKNVEVWRTGSVSVIIVLAIYPLQLLPTFR